MNNIDATEVSDTSGDLKSEVNTPSPLVEVVLPSVSSRRRNKRINTNQSAHRRTELQSAQNVQESYAESADNAYSDDDFVLQCKNLSLHLMIDRILVHIASLKFHFSS